MAMTNAQERELARIAYDEAVRVSDAYRIQLQRRKVAVHSDPAEKARRIEDAARQLESAERAEYNAWERMNHLQQMVVKKPWITV
jgi:hypothetical protein